METSEGEACRDWRSPPRSPSAITGSGLADGVDDSRSGQAALSEAEYDLATQFLTRAIRSGELSLEVLAHAFYDRGIAYGETDDYGENIVSNPVHVHDYHATILHLMGLDHTKLTYRYGGRDFRLTDVGGQVLQDILT